MTRGLLFIPVMLLAGCSHPIEHYTLPEQVTDFNTLFANNCAGCHGPDGRSGAARPLNDPVFLAVIGKDRLREVITYGVPNSPMPAFAKHAGGELTEQQIAILADQMEERWSHPQDFANVALPPYSAGRGDAASGGVVFSTYCARCHGEGEQLTDPSFLDLVSDQSLRTTVIAGRADLRSPDWRHDSQDHVLSPQEISDVVAWISMHRPKPFNLTQRGTILP